MKDHSNHCSTVPCDHKIIEVAAPQEGARSTEGGLLPRGDANAVRAPAAAATVVLPLDAWIAGALRAAGGDADGGAPAALPAVPPAYVTAALRVARALATGGGAASPPGRTTVTVRARRPAPPRPPAGVGTGLDEFRDLQVMLNAIIPDASLFLDEDADDKAAETDISQEDHSQVAAHEEEGAGHVRDAVGGAGRRAAGAPCDDRRDADVADRRGEEAGADPHRIAAVPEDGAPTSAEIAADPFDVPDYLAVVAAASLPAPADDQFAVRLLRGTASALQNKF